MLDLAFFAHCLALFVEHRLVVRLGVVRVLYLRVWIAICFLRKRFFTIAKNSYLKLVDAMALDKELLKGGAGA